MDKKNMNHASQQARQRAVFYAEKVNFVQMMEVFREVAKR